MPNLPERREVSFPVDRPPFTEVGKSEQGEAEKQGWVKSTEPVDLEKPVTHQGQTVMSSANPPKPNIVLPVSSSTYLNPKNWHKPITFAVRWLLEIAKRIAKMNPRRTVVNES